MTKRQLELLRQAREDIKAKRRWNERALSTYEGGSQMSWDEMQWLGNQIGDITVAGLDVVLEARDIIERAMAVPA